MTEATVTVDNSIGAVEPGTEPRMALVLLWSAREPHRVGEVLLLPPGASGVSVTYGRGAGDEGLEMRITPSRQRPGRTEDTGPISDPRISRRQLVLTPDGDDRGVRVENHGRCPLVVRHDVVSSVHLRPGDTALLRSAQLWYCTRRPPRMAPLRSFPRTGVPAFGMPDAAGLVGETPLAWEMREQAAFLAGRRAHVLVHGQSGTGKELVARSIHQLSDRGGRSLIARNAATIPPGLVDAELFGNIRDYPNPGMRDRPGLFGEADGSTLFLDEIAEVPEEVHAHLLRVLDDDGEYHRLGEARARHTDFRLIAATNRGTDALKHDLLARLKLRIELPGLGERRSDVPLLVRHVLARTADDDPEIARRFFREGHPNLSAALVDALVHHTWTHHVRELEVLLWRSIASSPGDRLELTDAVTEELSRSHAANVPTVSTPSTDPRLLTGDDVRSALEAHGWVLKDAWQALGLKNRFQLIRLIKKHGIERPG